VKFSHTQYRFLKFCVFSIRSDQWHPAGSNLLPKRTAIALVKKGILETVEGQDNIYEFTPTGKKSVRDLAIAN
jgi:hypothetical protein